MPPIGTTVTVMGDVIEYDGRIWIQSLGAGAMEWTTSDLPEIERLAIAGRCGTRPCCLRGRSHPTDRVHRRVHRSDATFTSAYLGDHPNYGNSEHQMHLIIRSAIGQWVEATSKVEVQGILTYQQRDLRVEPSRQGPEILVDRNHVVNVSHLDWNAEATWSYQSGQTVTMTGVLDPPRPTGDCTVPAAIRFASFPDRRGPRSEETDSMHNTLQTVEGRLMWSETESGWCIDANNGASPALVNPETPISLMAMLSLQTRRHGVRPRCRLHAVGLREVRR